MSEEQDPMTEVLNASFTALSFILKHGTKEERLQAVGQVIELYRTMMGFASIPQPHLESIVVKKNA